MSFIWFSFLFMFLPLFLLVYYLVPKKAKNAVLALGSLLFCAWGDPAFVLILLALSLITFLFGHLIVYFSQDLSRKRMVLLVAIAVNIGVLLYFNIGQQLIVLMQSVTTQETATVFLPLGMGYYILSCISYLVDIARGTAKQQANLISFLIYVAMFPKLLAGPVVRYEEIEGALQDHEVTVSQCLDGAELIAIGLAKKVILADSIYPLWQTICAQDLSTLPALTAWLGGFAILFALYFDFSGYADIARGLGKLIGFHLPMLFNSPLTATNMASFFSRFNRTLFHWFRHYIPVIHAGENKRMSRLLTLLLIVFSLIVWQGFYPPFVLSALYFLIIIFVQMVIPRRVWFKAPHILRAWLNVLFLVLGAVILSLPNFGDIASYFQALFGFHSLFNTNTLYYFGMYFLFLLLCVICSSRKLKHYLRHQRKIYPRSFRYVAPISKMLLFVVSLAYLVSMQSHGFLCTAF